MYNSKAIFSPEALSKVASFTVPFEESGRGKNRSDFVWLNILWQICGLPKNWAKETLKIKVKCDPWEVVNLLMNIHNVASANAMVKLFKGETVPGWLMPE